MKQILILLLLVPGISFGEVVIESLGSASLPREDADNSSYQGETWREAAENWMTLIRSRMPVGSPPVGVGQAGVVRTDSLGDYTGLVTSAPNFQSWKARAQSDGTTPVQWGNRVHSAVSFSTTDGETFIPADVNIRCWSEIWNSGFQSYVPDRVVNFPTTLATTNYFRIRLGAGADGKFGTSDDVPIVQDSSLPTQSFIFGGIGSGIGAFGSGSNQDKIDNVLVYDRANVLRLVCEVTVPYKTAGGANGVKTKTFYVMPDSCPAEWGLEAPDTLVLMALPGAVYRLDSSPDLKNWETFKWLSGSGETRVHLSEYSSLEDRYFYRVACFNPGNGMKSKGIGKLDKSVPQGDSTATSKK